MPICWVYSYSNIIFSSCHVRPFFSIRDIYYFSHSLALFKFFPPLLHASFLFISNRFSYFHLSFPISLIFTRDICVKFFLPIFLCLIPEAQYGLIRISWNKQIQAFH